MSTKEAGSTPKRTPPRPLDGAPARYDIPRPRGNAAAAIRSTPRRRDAENLIFLRRSAHGTARNWHRPAATRCVPLSSRAALIFSRISFTILRAPFSYKKYAPGPEQRSHDPPAKRLTLAAAAEPHQWPPGQSWPLRKHERRERCLNSFRRPALAPSHF